jgi:hypothetical protein
MIDISGVVTSVTNGSDGWAPERAVDAASQLAEAVHASVDWDRDAGEGWISLLRGGRRVAMLSAVYPIAFVAGEASIDVQSIEQFGIGIVRVESFDDEVLVCDPAVLSAAFAVTEANLPRSGFSANDLWFATI